MDQGEVLEVGTPTEIYERPTSRFVADFISSGYIDSLLIPGEVVMSHARNGDVLAAQGGIRNW